MRYIVAVSRVESVTTAAQVLNISQPALTRNIAEVEQELGVALFHRLPRGIALTEHGARFVRDAQRILAEVDDLVSEIAGEQGVFSGRLKIGLISEGYVSQAKSTIRRIATEHPEVGLEFISGSTSQICPRLLHGELNLVLGSNSYLEKWRDIEVHRLAELRFTSMVRKHHPLVGTTRPKERELLGYPLVLNSGIEAIHADIAQRYNKHGLDLTPHYVAHDWDMVKELVLATDAFFPLYFRPSDARNSDRRFYYLHNVVKMPQHHISLAYASHRVKTPLARLFEAIFIEELERDDV